MSPGADWRRLKELVTEAEALGPEERAAFLAERCGDDEGLLAEALSLLGPHIDEGASAPSHFLERPAVARVDAPPLAEGERLGPYRVLRPLGSGGMGDVYLGERADEAYEERVAIKVARSALGPPELRARFLSERRLLAELRHPHIARLLDAGSLDDGRPYFVMEHIEGAPIHEHCRRHGLTVRAKVELMAEVASAVAHAHRHLVIHRDLKPANIFVDSEGAPKLLDFGIAKDLSGVGKTPDTRFVLPMTLEYAAPEQLAGRPASTAADVYALGVVLYELLTGSSPFGHGGDPLSGRSRASRPTRPSRRVEGLPAVDGRRLGRQLAGDLDALILKALEPDPADRYSSVEALERDMRNYLDDRPLEARGGRAYRARKWVRRHAGALGVAAAVLALVAGWAQARLEAEQARQEKRSIAVSTRELGDYVVRIMGAADPEQAGRRNPAFEAVVEEGSRLLAEEDAFQDSPLVRAALQTMVGQVQRKLGRFEAAEDHLREGLEIRRRLLPRGDSEIAIAANSLALVLRNRGRVEESKALLLEAERILTEQPPTRWIRELLASVWSNLGGIEKALKRYDASIVFFRRALEAKIELWPSEPEILAQAHKNLAAGLVAAGRYGEADGSLRQAEAALDQLEDDDRVIRSAVHHYQGLVAWKGNGDLEEARHLLEAAYRARLDVFEDENERRTRESREALEEVERRLARAAESSP